MAHLELYHHFQNVSNPPSSNHFFCLATPEMADAMKNSALEHSVQVPYLMHQLLAISARDRSRRASDGDEKASYLKLAAQLQTHALALFDASSPGPPPLPSPSPPPAGPRQGTPATLAFASMLGTHALCDALATLEAQPAAPQGQGQGEADERRQQRCSLQDFLPRWLEYARLHRGVSARALAPAGAPHPPELRPLLAHGRAMAERQPAGHETDALLARVAALQGLSPEVHAACLAAVDLLQVALDAGGDAPPPPPGSSSSSSASSTTTSTTNTNSTPPPPPPGPVASSSPEHLPIWWALSVPDAFVDALATGLPDLVAVLAYYAVLLHRARASWAVGPAAGTRLLQVLTAHLGLRHAEALAWPRRELGLGHFGAVYEAGSLVGWPGGRSGP